MLQQLRVGELGLTAYNWSHVVSPHQFAAFHHRIASRCRCSPNGDLTAPNGEVAFIFDTVEEARDYCAAKLAANSAIGVALYTGTGQLLELHEDARTADYHHGLPSAYRALMWAMILIVGALLLTAMDWWTGWSSFAGLVLATKLVMVFVMKLSEGLGGILATKRERD
jgi:hypothetical protein